MTTVSVETMSSTLDCLVPILDGTNYHDWQVLMQSFLQMQELWEVVGGRLRMPAEPIRPTAPRPTPPATTTLPVPLAQLEAYDNAMAAHRIEYNAWNLADNKALGAITLRLAPQLRHYRTANITARQIWTNLERAFGAPSMSAIFADFRIVMGSKLSGGNPVPEIERIAELYGRLALNNFPIADSLQGLMLLAALPNKWDSIVQLFMQRSNLAQVLTFSNVRAAIIQEYERSHRPVDRSANKLSAVKRKGPDPHYRQPQQSQPGPSWQPQQQQQGEPKVKRRGGRQQKERKERRDRKAHDHFHFASTARIEEVVEAQPAPIYINASQPSRAAPLHSSVASFSKNGIEYRKVVSKPPSKPTLVNSIWPSLTEAREICDSLAVPKTARNLRPLEAPRVTAPIFPTTDPFKSYRKAEKKVKKMIDPQVASTSTVRLVQRISSPLVYPDPDLEMFDNYEVSGYDWKQPYTRESSREPPVSLGEEQDFYDPYDFDHSDESDDNCPRRIGTLEMRMQIDEDIADAAGLPAKGKGKQKERQVPLISCNDHLLTTPQCTRGSTSAQVKEEPLGSDVDYKRALLALVNVLNKIEFHSQSCEKCKRQINDHKAWILDSGASQHFTSTKQDFIDFEVVTNAPEVKTAAANAVLHVEGKGAILLSHFVENRGIRTKKLTRIYPVLYIPGLSVKLLSMGVFLHDKQEVRGNAKHITFHDALTLKPRLSAYLQNP